MEGGEEGGEPEVGVARREQRARCMPQQQEQRPGSSGPEEEGEGRSGCCGFAGDDCFERTKEIPIAHTPRVRDTSPHDRHIIVHRSHARQTVRTCDTPAGSLYYTTTLISLFSLPLSARLYFPLGSARHTNSKLSLALAKTQHTRAYSLSS